MTLVRVGTSPIDRQGLFATADILQGTRIIKFPCHCGAKNCCGYILGREYWGRIPYKSGDQYDRVC